MFVVGLIGFIIVFIIIITTPIFLIAFLASQSRKKKRKKIIETLPPDVDFYAAVRINSSKRNDAFWKLAAFECSGILYIHNNKIIFRGTKQKYELLEFDLGMVKIFWIGVEAQNGALQWFSIRDEKDTYYFNVDTGMTIFNFSKSGDTTKAVYNKLINAKNILNIGNIGKN